MLSKALALWPAVLLVGLVVGARGQAATDLEKKVQEQIANNKVQIFSKSYCPFCQQTKQTFEQMKVDFHADELDKMPDGEAIQNELAKLTGQRTVPNIFIGGVHLGGNDALKHAKNAGKLPALLEAAGIEKFEL